MKPANYYGRLLQPWAGFLGGGLGWLIAHQFGSDRSFADCLDTGWPLELAIGFTGLVLAGVGALLGWAWVRRGGESAPRFVAFVGTLAAAVFAVAIVLQTAATLIIPRCHA